MHLEFVINFLQIHDLNLFKFIKNFFDYQI